MKLRLPHKQESRIRDAIKEAGRQEIGGVLMGEQLDEGHFRIVEVTVQRSGGSTSGFVRDPKQHAADINAFFERTDFDFTRFNYLGEWHSHPSFFPWPSSTDKATMREIVNDDAVGVNFAVLLVVKLGWVNPLNATATVFRRGHPGSSVASILYERGRHVWI